MALINGKVLLQDFVCGFVVIFAMVVCFVSISFEKTILNESYLLKQNEQSRYVQKYKRIYDEVLIYCAQSVDFSSEQARENPDERAFGWDHKGFLQREQQSGRR